MHIHVVYYLYLYDKYTLSVKSIFLFAYLQLRIDNFVYASDDQLIYG